MLADENEADVELARAEAEAALPPGWKLSKVDQERYNAPGFKLDTVSASAVGPGGEVMLAIGLSEAAAWRHLVRRFRGELAETDGWAPPLPR